MGKYPGKMEHPKARIIDAQEELYLITQVNKNNCWCDYDEFSGNFYNPYEVIKVFNNNNSVNPLKIL